MIDYPAILDFRTPAKHYAWTERDVMLYALALGMGENPTDPAVLPFIQETGLRVLPTFATVAAWGAGINPAKLGADRRFTLHGEQSATFHRPLPATGAVLAQSWVVAAYDGGEKGALVVSRTALRDPHTQEPLVTLQRTGVFRGRGGFGGPPPPSVAVEAPARNPDFTVDVATRPDQALLYRLCGDRNPLHADPAAARRAGFERPILHGLCTYGLVGRAVLQACCGGDPTGLQTLSVRFAAPVQPGDTVTILGWREADGVALEAYAAGRRVIRNGRAVLQP